MTSCARCCSISRTLRLLDTYGRDGACHGSLAAGDAASRVSTDFFFLKGDAVQRPFLFPPGPLVILRCHAETSSGAGTRGRRRRARTTLAASYAASEFHSSGHAAQRVRRRQAPAAHPLHG